MTNTPDPVDLEALRADDQLIEDLRNGAEPPTDDQIAAHLADLRDRGRE